MRPLYAMALMAGAVVSAIFFLAQGAAYRPVHGWLVLAWLLALGAAARDSRRGPSGSLRWAAGTWSWDGEGRVDSGTLTTLIDLQQIIVATLATEGGRTVWVCLRRHAAPASWPALRRAIVSSSGRPPMLAHRDDDGTHL